MQAESTAEFQATEGGFRAEVNGQIQEFRDDQIVGISVLTSHVDRPGGGAVTIDSVKLRVRDTPTEFFVETETGPHEVNFLEPFRDRVLQAALDNAWSTLKLGDEVEGVHWSLSSDGLLLHASHQRIPLEQVNGAAWYDDVFYVWQADVEDPILEVPAGSLNALILADIMGSIVDGAPKGAATASAGAGRMLADFNEMRPAFSVVVGGGIGLAVFIALFALPFDPGQFLVVIPVVSGLLALGLCSLLKLGSEQLRVFEREFVRTRNNRSTTMRYDQLESMSMHWVDHYYNHGYTHTTVEMSFEADASVSKPIRFTAKCKTKPTTDGRSESLIDLRNRAAAAIADRMRATLDLEGRVAWTKKLTITTEGIEAKKLLKSEPLSIPYGEIKQWSIKGGKLSLSGKSHWTSHTAEETSVSNFFPGWILFQELAADSYHTEIDEKVRQLGST